MCDPDLFSLRDGRSGDSCEDQGFRLPLPPLPRIGKDIGGFPRRGIRILQKRGKPLGGPNYAKTVEGSTRSEPYDRPSALLSGLIDKLDNKSPVTDVPTGNNIDLSGLHNLSSSEGEDREIPEC